MMFGLSNFSLDYSVRAHRRLAILLCSSIIGVVFVSFMFNITSFWILNIKALNILLLFGINATVVYLMTRPDVLAFVGSAGFVAQMGFDSAKETLKNWRGLMFRIMLYVSLFLLVSAWVDFTENMFGIFIALALLITFFLMDMHWGLTATFAKYVVYAMVLVSFVVVCLNFMPSSTRAYFLGFDPIEILESPEYFSDIHSIMSENQKNQENAFKKALKPYKFKVEKGCILTEKDLEEIQAIQGLYESEKLPNKGFGIAKKGLTAIGEKTKGLYYSIGNISFGSGEEAVKPSSLNNKHPQESDWNRILNGRRLVLDKVVVIESNDSKNPTPFARVQEGDIITYVTEKYGFNVISDNGNSCYKNPPNVPRGKRYFTMYNIKEGGEFLGLFSKNSPIRLEIEIYRYPARMS
ncbi:hypothetical protein KAI92_04355 [Candidatus Parcubacteria bacterium]|nr:hypothetical protein [Candidatus Parcubacteria bacterium]